MSYEAIIYEKHGGIATLTFNRPQAMNAGNMQLYGEMGEAMRDAANDDQVRVLILTGAGRPSTPGTMSRRFLSAKEATRETPTAGKATSPAPRTTPARDC